MGRRKWMVILVLAASSGCGSFDRIRLGECGNGVLEANEDCDFFGAPDGDAGVGGSCGLPSDVNACFFTCEPGDENNACPTGFGCGADLRCRRASGAYVEQAPVSFPVTGFETGDIDGDGAGDIVGATSTRLFVGFAGEDGAIDSVEDVAASSPRPFLSLGDLNGDERTDIVSANFGGIGVHLGSADRSLLPEVFPRFLVPSSDRVVFIPVDIVSGPEPRPDELTALAFAGPSVAFFAGDATPVDLEALLGVQIERDAIRSPILVGNFDGDADHEIAFTFIGADSIWLLDVSLEQNSAALSVGSRLTIPSGKRVRGIPRLGDFDGDNRADLNVSLVNPSVSEAAVFLRLPGNGFGPSFTIAAVDQNGNPFLSPNATLLAVGSLNAFPGGELVTSEAIFGGGGLFIPGNWVAAGLGDFNADGEIDVLAVPDGAPGVELFLNVPGENEFNRFFIGSSTFGTTTRDVVVGNFDGDFTSDALLTSMSPGGQQEVRVLYGNSAAIFDDPDPKARFDSVDQILPLSDGIGSLDRVIITEAVADATEPGYELSFLIADTSRALQAPLVLGVDNPAMVGEFIGPSFHVPYGAAVGRYKPDIDVGVLAAAEGLGDPNKPQGEPKDLCADPARKAECTTAWGIAGDGSGGLDSGAAAIAQLGIQPFQLACRGVKASDVRGAGFDQLIAWTEQRACSADGAQPPERIWVTDVSVGPQASDLVAVDEAANVGRIVDVIATDLDGDGLTELLVAYRERLTTESQTDEPRSGVLIYRLAGQPLGNQVLVAEGIRIIAIASADLDNDGTNEIIIGGTRGAISNPEPQLQVATFDPETSTFGSFFVDESLPTGPFVRASDVNRDGLVDLVVGNGATASVALAVPAETLGSQQSGGELDAGAGEGN